MGVSSISHKGHAASTQKTSTKKPSNVQYYTIQYKENGKTKTIKVAKGIKIDAQQSTPNYVGPCRSYFETDGKHNYVVKNPIKLSVTQIHMLKALEMADGKPNITKADLLKLQKMYDNDKFEAYLNKNAPHKSKTLSHGPFEGTEADDFDMRMYDRKNNLSYSFNIKS